ncbi:MAG: ATP-binding cassette domain-containing protein [Spirochaetaceae bacterium]|jgi:ABC-2 type transport system ATP-binding protein|nr:ATP-binding cassette domain-containing protein [Spirochaetaceae bacterium]
MNNAIEVKDLHKSFKKKHRERLSVLEGLSFTVPKGTIFALLGSNGAGKTTTIKILTTLLKPDSGTVTVCGFDVQKNASKVRENISLTGQFTAVDDILTGRENLQLAGRLRHLKNYKDVAEDMLARFGLSEAADRYVSTYSGGMRRRLDLAMSLAGNPPLIFLDEPTTGLDPEARNAVWDMVRQLKDGGTTIMLTTQYLEEADQLADSIAILHKGKIAVEGSPTELKKLLPQAKTEMVVKQPTLDEVFFSVIEGNIGGKNE